MDRRRCRVLDVLDLVIGGGGIVLMIAYVILCERI